MDLPLDREVIEALDLLGEVPGALKWSVGGVQSGEKACGVGEWRTVGVGPLPPPMTSYDMSHIPPPLRLSKLHPSPSLTLARPCS